MRSKMFLISAVVAGGAVFGLATGIGISVAATDSSHQASTSRAAVAKMHNAADMRAHMQAMHPSLTKSQVNQLVADCQKNGGMMDGSDMMGGGSMMGGHAADHSGMPSSGTKGGMMNGGMMG